MTGERNIYLFILRKKSDYLRNSSWKPEFVYSFNMGNIIFVQILS